MRTSIAWLCISMVSHSPTFAAQPMTNVDFGIALCVDRSEQTISAAMSKAVKRAIAPASENKRVGFRTIPCKGTIDDATCYAGERVMICRAAAIDRILRAAAWMAYKYRESGFISYDDFRLKFHEWNKTAIRYADGALQDEKVDRLLPELESGYVRYHSVGRYTSGTRIPAEVQAFIAATDYVMAALIGHEIAHVNGESCPVKNRSAAEQRGLISQFRSLHRSGSLFCARPVMLEEGNADVCALRHVSLVTQSLQGHEFAEGPVLLARRAAADLIGFAVTFGWRPRTDIPAGKYPFMELNEYFYAPLRLLAYAAELHPPGNSGPAVCGESASLFVFGTQQLFKQCDKAGGIVDDNLLALIPPAVETAWNGGSWSPGTFRCLGR